MSKKAQPKNQEQNPRNKGGRPLRYKPEFGDLLIEWMAKGNPFVTFGKCIVDTYKLPKKEAPCESTLYSWAVDFPEFLEAKKIGSIFERDKWETLQLRCALTGKGNMTAIIHALKNKYRKAYGDRAPKGQQQIQLNASMDVKQLVANMQPEQMVQLIAAIEAKTMQLEESKDDK